MPNWTNNTVSMKGISKEDLYTPTKDWSGKMTKSFDFGKLVPEPKTKEELLSKYGNRYLNDGYKNIQEQVDKPWFDWYGWHSQYWGTKWNACECQCDYDDDEIQFMTAWNEPAPIWHALSLKYPDRHISISADYEDGYVINSEWLNGNMLWEETNMTRNDDEDDDEEEET